MTQRLALSVGEPSGIGPDLAILSAQRSWPWEVVAYADPRLLAERARRLGLPLRLIEQDPAALPTPSAAGTLRVIPVPLAHPAAPGHLEPGNGAYVIKALNAACETCLRGESDALVTCPVSKAVINDAGIAFTGHTEHLARLTKSDRPVMLLEGGGLRVALATTHLPLSAVPTAISQAGVEAVLDVLLAGLKRDFGIAQPRILLLGLNPHAGEGGHLGSEERVRLMPAVEKFRASGHNVVGPLPSDTAFVPARLAAADAVLAMYHDQGLSVLKYAAFGRAVNVTLGLPIVRTSVDHGTALDRAGTGRADPSSLYAALNMAATIAVRRSRGV